jgi:hypothetical protein
VPSVFRLTDRRQRSLERASSRRESRTHLIERAVTIAGRENKLKASRLDVAKVETVLGQDRNQRLFQRAEREAKRLSLWKTSRIRRISAEIDVSRHDTGLTASVTEVRVEPTEPTLRVVRDIVGDAIQRS